MRENISDSIRFQQLLAPVSQGSNVNSASMDLKDADMAAIKVSTGATVDAGLTAQIEESEDDSTFTAIPDAAGVAIAADALAVSKEYLFEIDARLRMRYVRVAFVCPGTSLIQADGLISKTREAPVTQATEVTKAQLFRV